MDELIIVRAPYKRCVLRKMRPRLTGEHHGPGPLLRPRAAQGNIMVQDTLFLNPETLQMVYTPMFKCVCSSALQLDLQHGDSAWLFGVPRSSVGNFRFLISGLLFPMHLPIVGS